MYFGTVYGADDDLRMMIPAPPMVGAATHLGALGRLS
eukprot:COSAG01_NODE_16643_length_1218_cov_1.944593_1_plen_36_part_10